MCNWMQCHQQKVNTLRLRQNGRHFPDDIFKCIFLSENVSIAIQISLKLVCKGPINNIPTLVQILAWRCPGDKPLSEPMMVSSPTHICVTRPQWVNPGSQTWSQCVKPKMYPFKKVGVIKSHNNMTNYSMMVHTAWQLQSYNKAKKFD